MFIRSNRRVVKNGKIGEIKNDQQIGFDPCSNCIKCTRISSINECDIVLEITINTIEAYIIL